MNAKEDKTMNAEESDEKPLAYGIFSQDDIVRLNEEWLLHQNPQKSLEDIATKILQHYNVRSYDEVVDIDYESRQRKNDILTAFLNIQKMVLTKKATKVELREHKKGDFIRDANNDPIPTDDGKDYKTYTKDVVEKAQIEYDKPIYDYINATGQAKELEKSLRSFYVLPDYNTLRAKYEQHTNYEEACDIIKKLTSYYIFDDAQTFINRFAMLIANAKAKALGYRPKWCVLFSLVGDMGVGKSWLSKMISDTFDNTFGCRSDTTTYDRLFSRFNGQMTTRGFLRIEEAAGLDKTQIEQLKDYITSDTIQVERKGMDIRPVANLVTFFSTTNESVIGNLVGSDKNRRVVEFIIKEKLKPIPEEELRSWLENIWKLMPCRVPNEDEIERELMEESQLILDVNLAEVVYDIFKNHELEVVRGKRMKLHQFKSICVQNKVQVSKVLKWCEEHLIVNRAKDGHTYVSKRGLNDLYEMVENSKDKVQNIDNELERELDSI